MFIILDHNELMMMFLPSRFGFACDCFGYFGRLVREEAIAMMIVPEHM